MKIKEYIKYLKKNPKRYWFKRKLYGWGWVPATWQGWLTLLVWAILFTFSFIAIEQNKEGILRHTLFVVFITITLIWVCYKKGEKPRWSWGK